MKKTLLISALIATIATPGFAESPGAESTTSVNCAGLRVSLESGKLFAPSKLTPKWHTFTAAQKRSISAAQRRQLAIVYSTYC